MHVYIQHDMPHFGYQLIIDNKLFGKLRASKFLIYRFETSQSSQISYPQLTTAKAVFRGSKGSGGGGLLLVFTAQNRQPRVQVSPSTMMVAVAMPSPSPPAPPPPFQHCARNAKTSVRLNTTSKFTNLTETSSHSKPSGKISLKKASIPRRCWGTGPRRRRC